MSAPRGNKNAQKWTLERTLEVLHEIDNYSYSMDCLYLGHALSFVDCYEDVWAYWRRKWKGNYEVTHLMKSILQRFEYRILERITYGKMPQQVGMFVLRHHYGWGKENITQTETDLSYLEEHDQLPDEEPEINTPDTTEPSPEPTSQQIPIENASTDRANPSEFMLLKVKQYNEANPHSQILRPAGYFDGEPPPILKTKAIEFDGGYFLKC